MNVILFHLWEHRYEYLQLSGIGILILFVVTLTYVTNPEINYPWLQKFQQSTTKCFLPLKHWMVDNLNVYRGKQYFSMVTDREQDVKGCLVTTWNLIHLVSHFILGMLYPCCWFGILFVTTIFEMFECWFVDCHDLSDLFYNVFGMTLGVYLVSP